MAASKEPKKKVERKFVDASTKEVTSEPKKASAPAPKPGTGASAESKGKAVPFRIFAVVLWLVGLVAEVLTLMVLGGKIYTGNNQMMFLIIGIVVDLIAVIAGSQLWKHANRLDPASEANKVKFFLWNNLGLIAAIICFLPMLILIFTNKNLDKKTKTIATVVAAVALVAAGATSYDFTPVSQEDLEQAQTVAADTTGGTVYWTTFGSKYHLNPDCSTIQNSATVYSGTVDDAFAAHRTELCKVCAENAGVDADAAAQPAEDAVSTPAESVAESMAESMAESVAEEEAASVANAA